MSEVKVKVAGSKSKVKDAIGKPTKNPMMQDKITGFIGRKVARIEYYDGGKPQVLLEALDSTGAINSRWFDEVRVKMI